MMRIAPALCHPLIDGRVEGAVRVATTVTVKADASSPEVPLAGALVRVLGAHDGRVVWRGQSDAAGHYRPTGLRSGRSYLPLAVHPAGSFEAVAAGPMVADTAKRIPLESTAIIGQPYSQRPDVAGYAPPCVVRHKSGALPSGVSFSVHSGFSGAWPTGAAGDYPVVMELQDAAGTVEQTMTIHNVLLPLALSVPTLLVPPGVAVSWLKIVATGGEGPYEYSLSAGTLPSGLSLDDETGSISGTTAATGDFSLTFAVEDARGATATAGAVVSVVKTVAYRYWRLNVTLNNGNGSYCTVAELELLGPSGTDVTDAAAAASGSASASGAANVNNRAALAFDDNSTNKWTSNTTTGWLQYDCGATTTILGMRLMGQYSGGDQATYAPKNFTLQGADSSGGPWTTVITRTGETGWGAGEVRQYLLD